MSTIVSDLERLRRFKAAGELTAEEFAAAKKHLLEHGSFKETQTGPSSKPVASPHLSADINKNSQTAGATVADRAQKFALFSALAIIAGVFPLVIIFELLQGVRFENVRLLNPLGAALLTGLLMLILRGFVAYDRRAGAMIGMPLFVVLFIAPLWKGDETDTPSRSAAASTSTTSPLISSVGAGGKNVDHAGEMQLCKEEITSQVLAVYDWTWGRAWSVSDGDRRIRKGEITFADMSGRVRTDIFTCTFDVPAIGNDFFIGY